MQQAAAHLRFIMHSTTSNMAHIHEPKAQLTGATQTSRDPDRPLGYAFWQQLCVNRAGDEVSDAEVSLISCSWSALYVSRIVPAPPPLSVHILSVAVGEQR